MWLSLSLLALAFLCSVEGNPDEVTSLPGLPYQPNFRHYSGYLNATNKKFLHYWFVESQRDPLNDPVVLWMNGGPGCSSLDGFLSELGPFHVKSNGKELYYNPYSWNKEANVIFLEAPAGVGFSYASDKDYRTNDDKVAADNYAALQQFFKKFPQFQKNEFYVTGESYGGIYIPTLSVNILTGPANINFKGFAIGNGLLNSEYNGNSIIFFHNYHGLVGKKLWDKLTSACCQDSRSDIMCNFTSSTKPECRNAIEEASSVLVNANLNVYNLYSDCATSNSRMAVDKRNMLKLLGVFRNQTLTDSPPCIDSGNIEDYLNQYAVRAALHIPLEVQNWTVCSSDVEFGYQTIYDTMKPQFQKLLGSKKLRALVYNGDVDMACNFIGDEWFVEDLKLKQLSTYRQWSFNDQNGGFVKDFENLSFVTIRGSGHMVPQDKPGPAYKMITSFLNNVPLK